MNTIFEGYAEKYLSKKVTVTIDRPLGSKHPKWGNEYPVNYGFVPGTKAPDGEEIDAYVLKVNEPLKEFSGKCVAVVHRLDDDDDKLIVVPEEDEDISDSAIRDATAFQEKFFKSEILRLYDKTDESYGFVPVFNDGGTLRTVIVKHGGDGHWTSPKGHKIDSETDIETARRELLEETGIKEVEVAAIEPIEENYEFDMRGCNYLKTVKYFVGLVKTMAAETPAGFHKEIPEIRWVTLEEAEKLLFPSGYEVVKTAFESLK